MLDVTLQMYKLNKMFPVLVQNKLGKITVERWNLGFKLASAALLICVDDSFKLASLDARSNQSNGSFKFCFLDCQR